MYYVSVSAGLCSHIYGFAVNLDLKQAPPALRKNIGILGYRGSREFEERAAKIPGRAKKREGLVSSLPRREMRRFFFISTQKRYNT